jgi:hypothetical protein
MNELLSILRDAVAAGHHEQECKLNLHRIHHRWAPPTHPLWKYAPPCDCWLGRAAAAVAKHNIETREQG